jgi:hypothetical protein
VSGEIVEFRRAVPPVVWSDGTVQTECSELVHLYASVPGRCQCGERLWEVEGDAKESPKPQEAREASDSR